MARTILRLEDSRDGAAFYLEWSEKIIVGNRAGPDESELTYEEIVDKFWRRRGETK